VPFMLLLRKMILYIKTCQEPLILFRVLYFIILNGAQKFTLLFWMFKEFAAFFAVSFLIIKMKIFRPAFFRQSSNKTLQPRPFKPIAPGPNPGFPGFSKWLFSCPTPFIISRIRASTLIPLPRLQRGWEGYQS
jgi:hypothetical protein